jgi:predicted helicase
MALRLLPYTWSVSYTHIMKKVVPKHPRTVEFVAHGLYAVNSFKELEAKISALESEGKRGAAWEVWAEGFFATQRQIDSHHYWPQGTEPPLLRKSLRLPRNDKGIDSVYLNQTQQYDACQCKFYIGRPTLGFGDLSTFLATALRSACQNKVVFTNCEDVVAEVRAHGVVLIRGSYLDQLTPNQLQEINDWLNQRPVIPVKGNPREDQKEAIQKINAALDSVERAQAIAACGTGKTLVAFWVAESRAPKTTLVLVPSLALLGQIRAVWFEQRKTSDFKFIDKCVCSDPRVKKVKRDDDIPATDCDFPVSTSADDVRQFLDLPTTQPKVLFCTYQSAQVLMDAGHDWDLAIFDEAHKTAVKNGGLFSTALDDTKIRIKKRIFFTATTRHYRLRQEDDEEREVWSMDNEDQYGKVVYDLTFPEAIKRDLICDYQALVTTFTTSTLYHLFTK